MTLPIRASILGIACSTFVGTANPAEVCAQASDLIALQVAALQQRLMVAALTCSEADLHNKFVVAYRSELVASDDALKDFFEKLGEDGNSQYHAFKTKMANLYSARSIQDNRQFCAAVRASFVPALTARTKNLAAFAISQPSIVNEPYTQCGLSIAGASTTAGSRPLGSTAGTDVSVKTRTFGPNGYSERSYLPQSGDRTSPNVRSQQDIRRQETKPLTHDLDDRRDETGLYCYPRTGSWMRCYRVNDRNPRAVYPYSYEPNPDRPGQGRAGWRSQPQRRNFR